MTGRSGWQPSVAHPLGSASGATSPMSTRAEIVSASAVADIVTVRSPASVRISWSSRLPRSVASACAKQRMPLPLISAREPSALNRVIRAVYPLAGSATSRPVGADATTPIAQLAAPTAPCRVPEPSTSGASSSTRKSLPRAWCFVRWIVVIVDGGRARRALPEPLRPPDRVRRRSSVRVDHGGTIGPVGRRTGGCG